MAVAAGATHTVIVAENGCAFACGDGSRGKLGTGNLANRLVPTRIDEMPAPVRQVAAGGSHTGIVTDAGNLLMCGLGEHGQLGLGNQDGEDSLEWATMTATLVPRTAFNGKAVLMVACGRKHTAAVTEGGDVYTFGSGEAGQLGLGNDKNQFVPNRVPAAAFRPNGSTDGHGEQIVMVAAGTFHTVAVGEAGHVFTWGWGESGQLGHGDENNEMAPRQVEAGWPSGQGAKVVFVAAGYHHTLAVTTEGRLYTWGEGFHGQLGHGDTANRLVPTLVGGFGSSEDGRVVMGACGKGHTLVVTQDGGLWACGHGRYGELGLRDSSDSRHVFERLGPEAFGGARVVTAAAGFTHSAAVTEDGALWTWGYGRHGRLGRGNEASSLVPTLVPGALLQNLQVGRCHVLPEAHALAFAMGAHRRLGGGGQGNTVSPIFSLKDELLEMVYNMSKSWAKGVTTREEGLGRLIGAGFIPRFLWPRPTPMPKEKNSVTVKVCRPCNIVFS